MSNSRIELLRSAFETIENLEKTLVQAYSYKERYVSKNNFKQFYSLERPLSVIF